jgi:hypothetical protein
LRNGQRPDITIECIIHYLTKPSRIYLREDYGLDLYLL